MGIIVVVGVGYEPNQLTLEAVSLLKSGARILLHTSRCGCAEWLRGEGIAFESLDALYESCEDFDDHARAAAEAVRRAAEAGDVVYGVFDVRDASVGALLGGGERDVRVVAGVPAEGALFARAQDAAQLLAASDWENFHLSSAKCALVRELDSRELAAEVKLKLMEVYPEESEIAVRMGDGGVARTKLYNLDRLRAYDHRTCAFVPAVRALGGLERYGFDRLCEIIETLCGPDGCPWDRAQTHRSLRPYVVEEAYEVAGAIDEGDPDHLCDELGDMLLQVVLHAEIARQHGEFAIGDVTTAISEKMIRRHSHIFGGDRAADSEAVADLWAKNKMAERGQRTVAESMRGIARSLPATMRAAKVLKRLDEACRRREDVAEAADALACAARRAAEGGADAEQNVGEALLEAVALARAAGVDPEVALSAASDRLVGRFEEIEAETLSGGDWGDLSEQARDKYWHLVKLSDQSPARQESSRGERI